MDKSCTRYEELNARCIEDDDFVLIESDMAFVSDHLGACAYHARQLQDEANALRARAQQILGIAPRRRPG